jgi:general nucleoside transport system permease protein
MSSKLGLGWRIVAPIAGALGALLLTALLFVILHVDPLLAYRSMLIGALGSPEAISATIERLVPICLLALGVALTFRCGLWNVGGEGQFYGGAIGAACVGILFPAPAPILIPLELLAGAFGGLLVAAVPAALKARLNTNEILVTLMFNFVPALFVSYLISGPLSAGASETSIDISSSGNLPWLEFGGFRLHGGVLLLMALVPVLAFLVARSPFGYRLRAIGSNPDAARASGINVVASQMWAFLIAGALGGLAGAIQVTAVFHNLLAGMSPGYGLTAVVAALIGRLNPWGVLAASFALAALQVGGEAMQRSSGIESASVFVIEGLILLFLLALRTIGRERLQIA